jgi:uncharacterized protein (TIGR03083 family)
MSGTVASGPDTMCLAHDERADLADLLATLTPEQWDGPTLCTRWRVRDVVAHVISYEELSKAGLVGRFLRGGLAPDRVNAAGVCDYADRSPDELVALLRDHLTPHGLTAGFGGRIALTDGLIHHQDIRRALDQPRTIPAERLRVALDFGRTAPTIHARSRIRGLRLVATDLDWSTGDGPIVEGPAEPLLMAIAGRPTTDELSGPGTPTLADRTTS